jgi:hypothetical protein
MLPGNAKRTKPFLSFGNFRLGKIDKSKFDYRCDKCQTDFHKLYSERLNNRLVLERNMINTGYVVWPEVYDKYITKNKNLIDDILVYSEHVSDQLFADFWKKFEEEQYLQIAYGVGYIDPNKIMTIRDSDKVTLFTNIKYRGKRTGYCVPTSISFIGLTIPITYQDEVKEIADEYDLDYQKLFSNTDTFSNTVKKYIEFVGKGKIFDSEGKMNEAFLHYVIALDLCFGEKNSSVQSVSNRVSIISYTAMGNSFSDQRKIIKDIYGERSAFVHSGKNVSNKNIVALEAIVQLILKTIFKAKDITTSKKLSFSLWLKKLDALSSQVEAENIITESQLSELGIVIIRK